MDASSVANSVANSDANSDANSATTANATAMHPDPTIIHHISNLPTSQIFGHVGPLVRVPILTALISELFTSIMHDSASLVHQHSYHRLRS